METNEILNKLPKHLKDLIIDQPYNEYTSQDHAVWRYVMKQNIHYLPKVAHHSYLEGLKKTGISINEIPHMYGMNRILKEIGWAAAAVDGFIPPAAFMEFQAYNVLVIAAGIRPIDQVGYTPAPDIIHEAAGHAPIIADEEYAKYLIRFGEIGSKAFSLKADFELYEAIRLLSILKTDPYSSKENIKEAESSIASIEKSITKDSELSLIRNLHWWTVEYGLIGDLKNPKIYGAGLLSSISESYNCLKENIKKLPYTIDAAYTNFDITNQQPQLFVTPDFRYLTTVLEEYAKKMAITTGGLTGIHKAIESGFTATCVLNSGLQISGTFTNVLEQNGEAIYTNTTGTTALAFNNIELENQGKTFHKEGFGFPIGKVKEFEKPLFKLNKEDIFSLKDTEEFITLNFVSGVKLKGKPIRFTTQHGKLILITFTDCMVTYGGKVMFDPAWGIYDMATGTEIISTYPGPADPEAFDFGFPQIKTKTHKIEHTKESQKLHKLYSTIKDIREKQFQNGNLKSLWETILNHYSNEWLIVLELLELVNYEEENDLFNEIYNHLSKLKMKDELKKCIDDGLQLIKINEKHKTHSN